MNRRDILSAGAALVTISGSAWAQTSHGEHAVASPLFDTANNCVKPHFDSCITNSAGAAVAAP
jgi:hypothetical protein